MALLDSYTVRARLFPALLGVAPAIALVAMTVTRQPLGLPQVMVATVAGVLFIAFSDVARRFGRRAEQRLFKSTAGKPFPTVLRHRDPLLDPAPKRQYVSFIAEQLGATAPTAEQEEADPIAADQFYARCGAWLRERTRDSTAYKVLFEENVTYGFRRNLYGLKPFALILNLLVTTTWLGWLYVEEDTVTSEVIAIVMTAALHALYFLLIVTKKSVKEASDQYGRQLALACETLPFRSPSRQ